MRIDLDAGSNMMWCGERNMFGGSWACGCVCFESACPFRFSRPDSCARQRRKGLQNTYTQEGQTCPLSFSLYRKRRQVSEARRERLKWRCLSVYIQANGGLEKGAVGLKGENRMHTQACECEARQKNVMHGTRVDGKWQKQHTARQRGRKLHAVGTGRQEVTPQLSGGGDTLEDCAICGQAQ
ncbi:hypothetical protein LX36DRAFT_20702 [Colletotrichum falcatum]|nr:hypothetical protein LX36DRAFT_20702 [Colletotrichum falcatum]